MKNKEKIIITLIALFLFVTMSIGYATYSLRLDASGQATFTKNGSLIISNAILTDYKNLQNPQNPTINGNSIAIDLNFTVARTQEALDDDYYATYTITVLNDSFYDKRFESGIFNPSVSTNENEDMTVNYSVDGISLNEIIPSKETKTFTVTIYMTPNNVGNFNVSGTTDINTVDNTSSGTLTGRIPQNSTGDLSGVNTQFSLTTSVINSYDTEKTFTITTGNSNFYIVDSSGNDLSTLQIAANTEENYTIYIRKVSSARFATSPQATNIYFVPINGTRLSMGVVTITVDIDSTLVDLEPPTISNLSATQQVGNKIELNYTGADNIAISHYIIETYQVNEGTQTLLSTNQTIADETTYTVEDLTDGTYFFKVTAVDTSGLTADTTNAEQEYKWTLSVTVTITNGGPNTTTTVSYGDTYETTVTSNNNYNLPTSLTVTMGGTSTSNYSYNTTSGALSIPNVTGDLTIRGTATAQGGCLIEGTKIKLADGTTKKIEDIAYDDLLLVWSYDTGSITEEYPIWIEKEKTTTSYTKVTFSDHSSIKIVGSHAFFSDDDHQFVSFKDHEKFHIGTTIAKVTENNQLKKVKVTKIETVHKKVKYYFVASTRYYNIISDDFITTDGYTELTNLYPFDDRIRWTDEKKVKTLDYSYFEGILPFYMYKGFRAGELAVLLETKETNMESFLEYIQTQIINPKMVKEPITRNNKRYWIVSTSKENGYLDNRQQIEEGTIYTLPDTPNIKNWYSTSEHKMYKPGDTVTVWTGMHFEANS